MAIRWKFWPNQIRPAIKKLLRQPTQAYALLNSWHGIWMANECVNEKCLRNSCHCPIGRLQTCLFVCLQVLPTSQFSHASHKSRSEKGEWTASGQTGLKGLLPLDGKSAANLCVVCVCRAQWRSWGQQMANEEIDDEGMGAF